MNKTQLLADIESKVLKVVKTVEESDTDKNTANVKSYITNVMEQDGDSVRGRNIGWYTIDEGLETEQAYFRDAVTPKRDFLDKFTTMLNQATPSVFIHFKIESVDEASKTGYARAVKDNGDETATEVRLFLYRDNVAKDNKYIELTT